MRLRATPPPPLPQQTAVLYLVSSAGHPSYGDELITRAWLDVLTELRPDAEVWLDCPHPGRASHLFRRTHPNLHVTSTLWELARSGASRDSIANEERIARHIRDLGTPRIDAGLFALRDVASVHILGGAYVDDLQQDLLGIITALAELRREFGVSVFATGLGMRSLSVEQTDRLQEQLSMFEHVEARDRRSAETIGSKVGLDDAFLALSVPRPVYDEKPGPESVVLVQGDGRAWSDAEAIRSIEGFLAQAPDDAVAFVEAVPPDDTRYIADTCPGVRVYSFGNIWFDGLPARAGQNWVTTRYHAHLLAAAVGAAGTVIVGQEQIEEHEHESLLELGTGWTVVPAGVVAKPTVNTEFPARARDHVAAKRRLAERFYSGARISD